jgi:hypothetical protein
LATLPERFNEDEAFDRYIQARRIQVDMLSKIGPAIRDLLTSEQRRKLPQLTLNYLDPRYLVSIREGTGTYVGGPSFGPLGAPVFIGGIGEMMMVEAVRR